MKSASPPRYRDLVELVHDEIKLRVPAGSVVLIASKGDNAVVRVDGYRAWHFPRHQTGVYAGHYPSSSVEALVHLRQLYSRGARYLVFPWTARWWLDHYEQLAQHLSAAHELTAWEEGVCVIYKLVQSDAFDAFARIEDDEDTETETRLSGEVLPLVPPTTQSAGADRLRVLTVLARFGTEQYRDAVRDLDGLFRRNMPSVRRTVVIVDNAKPRAHVERNEGALVIGGDNSASEFSAFDRAVDFIGSDIWSYDLVHFATSAFNRLYVAYLERFDAALLTPAVTRPLCIGHIDCYNTPIAVRSYQSQHWLRSCFFFLSPAEVKALGSFVSVCDPTTFFSGRPAHPFRTDAPLDERYRQYITNWLTGKEIGQGVSWHSSFALSPDTLPAFERKAQAILNEHLLSIRLRALGCRLVDVTWLSTMLRQQALENIAWTTSWRAQLSERDRDAVVVPNRPRTRQVLAV